VLGRRLLLLFAVLLGLTALVTSLAPRPTVRPGGGGVAKPEPTASSTPSTQSSERIERTISADAGRPRARLRARAGDVLALTVRGDVLDGVGIAALGKLEPIEPDSPARFDLLLDTPGKFRVTLLDARRTVGLIEVTPSSAPSR
jgi:hypothetical protein